MKMVKSSMEDVGLQWKKWKKCAVAHVKRGVQVTAVSGGRVVESTRIPCLADGEQYKFLGVLESVRQEDKLVLECAAREYLRRLSVIWTSPLSDYSRVVASNQFALPVLGYLMWTQQWPMMELKQIDREARKIVVESEGRHPCSLNALLYMPRSRGGRGLRSVEMEYKATKIKDAVRLHGNEDRALGMVREFEEQAARMGRRSIFKEVAKCAEDLGLELDLEHAQGIKKEVRRCQTEKFEEEIRNQRWQGRLVTTRLEDESLSADGCFWWLTEWKNCPSHTIAGLVELYEQLLPTRVYTSQKTHASGDGEVRCRLCGKVPESVAHILSGCSALAQSKYLSRHDAALKVLFYELLYHEGFIDEIPPWYSPDKPKPVYESENVKAYWDVPIYADQQEYQDLRANRIDTRIVNHQEKKVIVMEMSCSWVSNRQKKTSEKAMKYAPLRWEMKQKYPGYEISQYNIIVDVLGGWSTEVEVTLKELVGRRHRDVLKKMQRACISVTLNISRTFKVAIH
ncbi:uncharacterized protein LOC111324448 [Stylophora pistillata]|uniref:uncharacterized protein LOC111324448 n=1 Tax=Stylophora pistillata TaxID=50429 RepID=UPI000C041864|nr:uncharacterized protein LOC111324448 [Stylophora pistillata]